MSQSVREDTFEVDPPSQRVIEAVAETTGNDPIEVGPLYHVIDPDALDRLFAPTDQCVREGYVEFAFAGCDVVVRGGGEVEVSKREPGAPDGDESDCVGTSSDSAQ